MRRTITTVAVLAAAGTIEAATSNPTEIIAVATDTGLIAVLDKADATQVVATLQPFGTTRPAGVAVGDLNGDGHDDVIAACDGSVRVLTVGGVTLRSFTPYPGFGGGVNVAVGDVNGDGVPDIVTGAGPGAPGGHVKVFDGVTGGTLYSFFSQTTAFNGGIFVAAGDLDGDGLADIIVGAGPGAGPHVKVFNGGTGQLHASFFAYDAGFLGGVRVAAGDINGDGRADIITGAGPGAPGGHVKAFSGRDSSLLASFFAFDPSFTGGVHVAGATASMAVTPGAASGAFTTVRIFGANSAVQWLMPLPGYKGGLTVAQSPGRLGKAPARPKIPAYDVQTTW